MQSSNQIQIQKLEQRQSLSMQQFLFVRLLELPLEGYEERVRAELLENPALEEVDSSDSPTVQDEFQENEQEDYSEDEENREEENSSYEREVDEETLSELGDYLTVDDIPDYELRNDRGNQGMAVEDIPYSSSTSFYENLLIQLVESPLTESEQEIAKYLIGSFDDDGLLRKSLQSLSDELAIYQGIDTDEKSLSRILRTIQQFDPAGIGAQSLQECLLLQLKRKPDTEVKQRATFVLENCYEDFSYKRWDKLRTRLNIDEETLQETIDELIKLNPRPGSSLSESSDSRLQQIVPDFFVKIDDEENVSFSINEGNVPDLCINEEYAALFRNYSETDKLTRDNKEAQVFLQQKMDSAQLFINAIEQRRYSMFVTMQAIVKLQHDFFVEGDEQLLKPMLMKDVAELVGLDISTISRVVNYKYVETSFGIFPLKFFFGDSYRKPMVARIRTNGKHSEQQKGNMTHEVVNEEKTQRQIRAALQECIDNEDKRNPLTDDQLVELMKEKGFDMARRTIAKYRNQLGIPIARLRR